MPDEIATGPALLLPMEKGVAGWTRPGHGWATSAGVVDQAGTLLRTRDRQGEFMVAAEHPDGIDFSSLVPRGFMNDSHRAVAPPGALCAGNCGTAPDPACAVHGGRRNSVLVGIPDSIEYVAVAHALSTRDGKIGWYSHFHILDPKETASWRNADGSPRMRMLRDGTVTDEPFEPTPEERDRADWFWETGLQMQRDGRTLGQSIQGRETALPCAGGKCIVRATAHQIALVEYPHNPDASVEGLGSEMAKGEAPVVIMLAAEIRRRRLFGITSLDAAIVVARKSLRQSGVYRE